MPFIQPDVDGYVIESETVTPLPSVWFSASDLDRLMSAWADAPEDQHEVLEMILEVAREQVEAFAPKNEQGLVVPNVRLAYAQLQQAQNLWNAGRASTDGDVGPSGYSFTPRPLDKNVRAIIRPISGVADVF